MLIKANNILRGCFQQSVFLVVCRKYLFDSTASIFHFKKIFRISYCSASIGWLETQIKSNICFLQYVNSLLVLQNFIYAGKSGDGLFHVISQVMCHPPSQNSMIFIPVVGTDVVKLHQKLQLNISIASRDMGH